MHKEKWNYIGGLDSMAIAGAEKNMVHNPGFLALNSTV